MGHLGLPPCISPQPHLRDVAADPLPCPHHAVYARPRCRSLSLWTTLQPFCPPALWLIQLCAPPHLAPQLVMEDIFISGDPLLESVGLHELLVEELRAVIANAVCKAIIPLQAYAKEYRKYLELNNNDVGTFLKCVGASECVCLSV